MVGKNHGGMQFTMKIPINNSSRRKSINKSPPSTTTTTTPSFSNFNSSSFTFTPDFGISESNSNSNLNPNPNFYYPSSYPGSYPAPYPHLYPYTEPNPNIHFNSSPPPPPSSFSNIEFNLNPHSTFKFVSNWPPFQESLPFPPQHDSSNLPNGIEPVLTISQESPKMNTIPSVPSISKESDKDATCEYCGKMYKHKSCLVKHQWEHHKHWETTKRLCESKHQQVQFYSSF